MILLISENLDKVAKIQEDLNAEGFKIEATDDFAKTLLESQDDKYSIVLLDFDYDYKNHDVLEICNIIKSTSAFKFVPLVGIIEKNKFAEQLMAFEMGVADFILHPYTTWEIQLKFRSLKRLSDLQKQIQQKDAQLENLRDVQRIMVTLNHHINNALTPLYFAVQIAEDGDEESEKRIRSIAKDTVEFISKVLKSLNGIVQSGKMKILQDGVYKDIMVDIEQELKTLIEKTQK